VPPKMYIWCTSPGDGQTSCKVWLASSERRRCSNEAKMRNPLKFAGCHELSNCSQPLVGQRLPYCEDMWRRYCSLTSFFLIVNTCLSCEDTARQTVRWCRNGDFLAIFCILYFQRAACSTFQMRILNSHQGHIMCGSMVGIQSAMAENRQGKKKEKRNHRTEI